MELDSNAVFTFSSFRYIQIVNIWALGMVGQLRSGGIQPSALKRGLIQVHFIMILICILTRRSR